MEALKNEYQRLVVEDGYNCSEAMLKVLFANRRVIYLIVTTGLMAISVIGLTKWKIRRE